MNDYIIGILIGIAIRPLIVNTLSYLIEKADRWWIGISIKDRLPNTSQNRHDFNPDENEFDIAEKQYQESKTLSIKVKCAVCGKEIKPEEFKRKEVYSSFMPDCMGLDNQYFHKRCRNNKVLLNENP